MHHPTSLRRAQLPFAVRALGALGTLVVLGLVFAAWWKHDQGVRVLDIQAGPEFWHDNGYVEMVPPLRLPGRAEPELHTSVWLRLPEHSVLGVVKDAASGRALLHYPPQTEAVRIELWQTRAGSYVADARGVRLSSPKAQQLYVLKPRSARDHSLLHGWSWPRGSSAAQARATLLAGEFAAKGLSEAQARTAQARVTAQNACADCHALARPEAQRIAQFGEVLRGTDADGLFQIQSVLSDHAPLESYAPREQNADDPAIRVRCGSEPALRVPAPLGVAFTCADHGVPMGYLDVPGALRAGDPRVQGLCRARRYLHEHLDSDGRAAFIDAFRACGIAK